MKKFFRFAAVAVAAFALLSCEKDPQDQTQKPDTPDTPGQTTPEYTEDLTFTLTVTEVEAEKAKIKVEHNGTTKDTWYGFATTETDIEQAIEDIIAEGGVTLKKNTSTTMTVRGLEPETDYTFVAVGITADGETYGEVATVEFTTTAVAPPAPEGYTVNPAWTIEYIHNYEYNGQTFEHVVEITSTDENPFLVTAWPKNYLDEYGIDVIAQAEIDGWKETLAGTQYTFADVLSAGSGLMDITELIDVEEYGNEWYALMIGADVNGNPTNLYAVSDLITVENEDLDPAYAEWLGNWTFTGANGLTQTVTFSKGVANKSYKMTGYEGQNLSVAVIWDPENQVWQINNQNLGTYEFNGGSTGDIWFIGEDAQENLFLDDTLPICMGGKLEDGTLTCIPFESELQMEDGSTYTYVVNDMLFLAYFGGNQLSYISGTYQTGYPTFPITITPASATASTFSVEKGNKHICKFMTARTFNCVATR